MPESELVSQRTVENFDRHADEAPAPLAYALPTTASSDLVVVCHIYIEHKFAL